jgi:hypothetical protein
MFHYHLSWFSPDEEPKDLAEFWEVVDEGVLKKAGAFLGLKQKKSVWSDPRDL